MSVLVCDACWACRNSVRQIVERHFEKIDVEELPSITQALEQDLEPAAIDLVIVDPFAEGGDWPGQLDRLCNRLPGVPITVFTMNTNRRDILRAIECGAKGYIHKSAEGAAIAKALTRIMSGEIFLSNKAFRSADGSHDFGPTGLHRLAHGSMPYTPTLSDREIEILELLAQGVTNARIGELLQLSVNTVRVYISGILKKLGLCDRTQAALYAVKMLAKRED